MMLFKVVLLMFNLSNGAAQVVPYDNMGDCLEARTNALKMMHMSSKKGGAFNAECLYLKVPVVKRDKA